MNQYWHYAPRAARFTLWRGTYSLKAHELLAMPHPIPGDGIPKWDGIARRQLHRNLAHGPRPNSAVYAAVSVPSRNPRDRGVKPGGGMPAHGWENSRFAGGSVACAQDSVIGLVLACYS